MTKGVREVKIKIRAELKSTSLKRSQDEKLFFYKLGTYKTTKMIIVKFTQTLKRLEFHLIRTPSRGLIRFEIKEKIVEANERTNDE